MPQISAAFVSLAGEGNTYGIWPLVIWGSQSQKPMMLPQPMVPTANSKGSFLPLAWKAKTLVLQANREAQYTAMYPGEGQISGGVSCQVT